METLWLYGRDGTRRRAYVHQDRISTSSMDGTSSIPGSRTCRLEDGTPLNYMDENTFKNPVTGELLSRIASKDTKKSGLSYASPAARNQDKPSARPQPPRGRKKGRVSGRD